MSDISHIVTKSGRMYVRKAWTGGDKPDIDFGRHPLEAELIQAFVDEQVAECGGLDLWECAGTTKEERLEIFKQRALLDAWRTWRG